MKYMQGEFTMKLIKPKLQGPHLLRSLPTPWDVS